MFFSYRLLVLALLATPAFAQNPPSPAYNSAYSNINSTTGYNVDSKHNLMLNNATPNQAVNISPNNTVTDIDNKASPVSASWGEVFRNFNEFVKPQTLSPEIKKIVLEMVAQKINEGQKLTASQFFVVVDRNPETQNAFLAFYDLEKNTIELSDATKISTGSKAKKHFITPLGWFEHTTDNGSYRALGTKNENGIRGIGKKGMRVFDFGWNKANAGWRDNFIIDIRLQMHATDPDILEKRLGRPDSQGCVRIISGFNEFLDKFGILDKHYEASADRQWVLRKDRKPVANAGSWMLVIDTAKNPKGI